MYKKRTGALLVIAIYVTAFCICCIYHYTNYTPFGISLVWLFAVISGLVSIIFFDLHTVKISPFHTIRSSFDHYVAYKLMYFVGWYMRRKLENDTKNISDVQEQFLLQRITNNKNTEYGKKYQFSEIKSREDFVQRHPLTRIKDYEPYIQRMLKGEENILTAEQPAMFAVTSGTSGKSNVLPTSKKQLLLFFKHGITVVFYSMLKMFSLNKRLQKTLKIFYTPRWRKSEGGLPIGPNSSSPTSTKAVLNLYSTPKAGLNILSEPEALYVHLLFGLIDKDLGSLEANFSSTIYSAFKALEIHKESLIHDIENGRISETIQIDEGIREELNSLLNPNPIRSKEMREAMSQGPEGLAKRLWPNCEVVLCCDTGAFELQAEMLKDTYCKGMEIYSPLYAASEGLIGINIWPDQKPSRYLLVPQTLFYEFIPIENSLEDQPKTLLIDQVKVGSVYEVVITNTGGLYRYRFGDVVRVVSLYNQTPVIEFMYRQGQFLNVRGEKTSETAFYQALTEASLNWNGTIIVDYCCVESFLDDSYQDKMESYAPFYHVFVELCDDDTVLSEDQKNMVDESLCRTSYVYQSLRNKGSIQPMKIHVVKSGTFQELRQFTIETTSASSNQYKCPRVLKRKESIHFMRRRVK